MSTRKDREEELLARMTSNMARHSQAKAPRGLADKEHVSIQMALIDPNPFQPRIVFDEEALQNLAESIREHGLIQPISVRKVGARYQIVHGERRFRAHQINGEVSIEAFLVSQTDHEMAVNAIIENLARQDLSDYEKALGFDAVLGAFPSKTELAKSFQLSRSDLYRYLDMLRLPDVFRDALAANPSLLGRSAASMLVSKIDEAQSKGLDETLLGNAIKEVLSLLQDAQIPQTDAAETFEHLLEDGDGDGDEDGESSTEPPKKTKAKPEVKTFGKLGKWTQTDRAVNIKLNLALLNETQKAQLDALLQSIEHESEQQ